MSGARHMPGLKGEFKSGGMAAGLARRLLGRTMKWVDYQKPKNLDEALRLLQQANGRGRVIAGGTDLIVQLKRKVFVADLLVDITGIEELRQMGEEDGWIRIGAGVTHAEVARSHLILREAMALAQGCRRMGSPQIRNMGTLVGNVVNAHAAGDGAVPLMALEAELKVASNGGDRWVALEEAYCGVGLSAVDSTKEVATEVRFKKLGEHSQTGFFRMAKRKALAPPIVNGAIAISLGPFRDRIKKARIAIGPFAYKPFLSKKAEAYLESTEISDGHILQACHMASTEGNPRTTLQASDLYRKKMVEVHLLRTMKGILDGLRKTQ